MNEPRTLSHRDFSKLRTDLHGELALPGEPGYAETRPWNLATDTRPAGVVVAEDVDDVRLAVRWAATHGLRIAVFATGHGSVGHGADVLVVHTGRLRECSVDGPRRTARIGAGIRAEQLLAAADEAGLAAVLGSTGTVGVVGYLSGGGVGPLVSTFGLSSDYVRAMDVVTADGSLHRATPDENPDLYWAMRGGKAALGIVTAVELDLRESPELYGGAMYFASADTADLVAAWATWSAALPETVTTSLALLNLPDAPTLPTALAGRFVASVRFASTLGRDEGQALLADVRRVAVPVVDTIRSMPYRDLPGAYGAAPPGPVPVHQDNVLLSALTPETVHAIVGASGPGSGSTLAEVELRRLGGALARAPRHPSAFSHRDAPYSLGITGIGTASSTVAEADRLVAAVRPWASDGFLANFVDTTDPARIARAYDPVTLARLRAIAGEYDPRGVFAVAGEVSRAKASSAAAPDAGWKT